MTCRLPALAGLMAGPPPELIPILLDGVRFRGQELLGWTADVVQYRVDMRAIVRLTVAAIDPATGQARQRQFYAKVYRDAEQGRRAYRAQCDLYERASRGRRAPRRGEADRLRRWAAHPRDRGDFRAPHSQKSSGGAKIPSLQCGWRRGPSLSFTASTSTRRRARLPRRLPGCTRHGNISHPRGPTWPMMCRPLWRRCASGLDRGTFRADPRRSQTGPCPDRR